MKHADTLVLIEQSGGWHLVFWTASSERGEDYSRSDLWKSYSHLNTAQLLSSLHQLKMQPNTGFLKY